MQKITLTDGRTATLDIGAMSPEQGHMLAVAAADLLIRSGRIRDDVAMNGPQLLQFMSELGDELAQDNEGRLLQALDAAHLAFDGSDSELGVAAIDRETAIERAHELRDLADPVEAREERRRDWRWAIDIFDLAFRRRDRR